MRNKIIIGNWKMNKGIGESIEYLDTFSKFAKQLPSNIKVGIASTTLCLPSLSKYSKDIIVSAQNCYFKDSGAFTGEVSAKMLHDVGINCSLIGHSERRSYFGENNRDCNNKIKALKSFNMMSIYCVGESLDEYESGESENVVKNQVQLGLAGLENLDDIVIAYEPVWSIGTGKSASPEIAQNMCNFIRKIVCEMYGNEQAEKVLIQYGGSVKANNVKSYLDQPDIDGVLVGGASLELSSFIDLINNSL